MNQNDDNPAGNAGGNDIRSQHVIIRASAGTGKTFQLTNQYLQQLFAGAAPEEILATTFTRKAAGEILERNMVRLATAALDNDQCRQLGTDLGLPRLNRKACLSLLRQLTRGLHRVRICTLDSFFSNLASSFGFEMGLPPDWTILDEIDATVLKNRAVDNVLRTEAPNDNEAAASIVQLMHLLTKGESTRSVGELIRQVVDSLYPIFQETDAAAWKSFPDYKMLSDRSLSRAIDDFSAAELPDDKRIKDAREANVRSALADDWESFVSRGLAAKVAAGETTYYRKELGKDVCDACRVLLNHARAVLVNSIARQTEATYQLLSRYDVRYSQLKDESRALQFDDVTRLLADVATDSEVDRFAFRMDSDISHVLLDEFQDTSLAQWQVIRPFAKKVTEQQQGTSFFCVGDIKQAIYGWRGGVAEIFDAIEAQLSGLQQLDLDKSYRSAPAIVETTNAIFNGLKSASELADADNIQEWCAAFRQHTTAHTNLPGYAVLEAAPEAESDNAGVESTLRFAAKRIAELTSTAPGASIGVLVRKNKHVSRLIFELRRLGVAASEEGGNPVTDGAAVQLLISVLKLADHPGNTVARFHIARSPLADHLNFSRYADDAEAEKLSRQIRGQLQAEGYGPVLKRWAAALAPACDSRGRRRLAQLVELAYRWQSHATLRTTDFLNFIEHEKVPDPTADRIRVMTVHQSKGLEFDIVVLPDLEGRLVGQTKSFVVRRPSPTEPIDRVCRYRNADVRELLPTDFQQMFDDARRRQISEALCVLYVAVTRAKHALHMIIAPPNQKQKRPPATMAGLLQIALAEPGPVEPGQVIYETGQSDWYKSTQLVGEGVDSGLNVATDKSTAKSESKQVRFAPMPDGRQRGMQRKAPSKHDKGRKVKLRSLVRHGSNAATERGTLIHAWFELIDWLDDSAVPPDDELQEKASEISSGVPDVGALVTEFHHMIRQPEIAEGLKRSAYLSGQIPGLPASVRELVMKTDPSSIRLEVHNEHAFAIRDGGDVISGFIDRLVLIYVDNTPVAADVIDFKTDTFDFANTQLFQEKTAWYKDQLQMYARVVSRLYRIPLESVATRLFMLGAGRVASI